MTNSHKALRGLFVAALTLATTSTFTLNAMKRLREESGQPLERDKKRLCIEIALSNQTQKNSFAQCTFSLCEKSTANARENNLDMIDFVAMSCTDSGSLINAIAKLQLDTIYFQNLVCIVSAGLRQAGLTVTNTRNDEISDIEAIVQLAIKNANPYTKKILLKAVAKL